jgi:hypothetical protein
LEVFENGVLRKIFGLMRDEVTGDRSKYVPKGVIPWAPHQKSFGSSNREKWGEGRVWWGLGRGKCIQDFGGET